MGHHQVVIPVPVERAWLKNESSLISNIHGIENTQLPSIVFKLESIKDEEIWPFGGNVRVNHYHILYCNHN